MANINRDYLIVLDAKSSVISEADELKYYITDEHSQNLFVNLVVRDIERINKYVEVHDPEKYQLELHIVKPNNDIVRPHLQANLLSAQDAIYAFELPKEATDYIGTYKCELRVTYQETDETTITTSNKFKYKVKRSIYNDLDSIQDAPQYPVVIQLLDKLSDIDQYEEDRRANELDRQLAEQQRQTRFDALDANMVDSIQQMDDKVVEVENRITTKEQAVDKLINDTKADIDDYKVAKDQEIDEYKATKDTEINNAITAQDNKINTAITTQNNIITQAIANQDTKIDTSITAQNDKIEAVQNNDAVQNNKLDTLQNKATIHEERITATEAKNTEQDNRLDIAENRLDNIGDNIINTVKPIIDAHTSRLDAIEAIDISQNNRLDAIEAKNQQQDDRLLDIEKVNSRQDIDIKCLYGASQTIDITKEGNSIYLQNSNNGFTVVDEIKGNTLVNCNKEPNKELILNGNINTSGDNTVTITEGVDGGLVDVALEGNTLVNVSKTKYTTAITKAYTVENSGNHIALQGDTDGSCKPVITGNTLWIDNHTEEVLTAFDETKNLRLQSSFEDNLVTQEMVDNGEEEESNLGKYRVDYKVTGKNLFDGELEIGTININNGLNGINTKEIRSTNYISIKPNTKYTFSCNNNNYHAFRWYDKNKNYLGKSTAISVNNGKTFTSPLNAYYARFKTGSTDITVNIQIEEGDTATSYEPYKENTKTLYLNSPLLEGDTIEEKDGGIYYVHRSELVAYTEGDEASLITDKVNTLHTLATPTYELIEQSNLEISSYTNGHLDFNTAVPVEKVDFLPFSEELTYLYANTKYTVQFISTRAILVDYYLGGTLLLSQPIIKGLNRISITTPSELVDNKLTINGNDTGANIMEVIVTDVDRELIYFEGMKSVGECEELQVISVNSDSSKLNTQRLTHEPLKAVRDVKDRYVLIDGKWYIERNCKEIELNSDSDIRGSDSSAFISISYGFKNNLSKSDKLLNIHARDYNAGKNGIYVQNRNNSLTYIYIRIPDVASVTQLREYLSNNTVKLIATLLSPVYEQIDYNPLEVYSGSTHIMTNSTIPPNIIVKNHGFNCLLKPSTTYTISSNLGLNTVTTPSKLTEDCLRFMDTDTSDVTTMKDVLVLEGDWTTKVDLIPANFSGIESAFEQEYDTEKGKYKVNVKVANEDKSKENDITFYINEPLRGVGDVKDRVYVKDDKVVVERNCGIRAYEDGDFGTYPTDKVNTVYPLVEPTYEEVEYNDTKLFIESFKNSTLSYNSNVPVTSKLYYSYSVPIVDTVAKTASISDEQDVMIIDLATQVAVMEMMLM